jgi:hypothetical protein
MEDDMGGARIKDYGNKKNTKFWCENLNGRSDPFEIYA